MSKQHGRYRCGKCKDVLATVTHYGVLRKLKTLPDVQVVTKEDQPGLMLLVCPECGYVNHFRWVVHSAGK